MTTKDFRFHLLPCRCVCVTCDCSLLVRAAGDWWNEDCGLERRQVDQRLLMLRRAVEAAAIADAVRAVGAAAVEAALQFFRPACVLFPSVSLFPTNFERQYDTPHPRVPVVRDCDIFSRDIITTHISHPTNPSRAMFRRNPRAAK
jgi:hypothetical protein